MSGLMGHGPAPAPYGVGARNLWEKVLLLMVAGCEGDLLRKLNCFAVML